MTAYFQPLILLSLRGLVIENKYLITALAVK